MSEHPSEERPSDDALRARLVELFRPRTLQRASQDDLVDCFRLILRRPSATPKTGHFGPLVEKGLKRKELFRSILAAPEFVNAPDDHRATVIEAYRTVYGKYVSLPGEIQWFHSIAMPDGDITDGVRAHDVLMREADCAFSCGVEGRSVLDIGAWDGFFSFEAERRGAASVLSVDRPAWSGSNWGSKAGYDFAHGQLGSKARSEDVDLYDLDPEAQGRHDVVLFLGVLYHLTDPLGGLAKAAAMAGEVLVVETVTAMNHLEKPVLRHYPGRELNNDASNTFAPNTAALRSMLGDLGFTRVEVRRNPGITATRDVPESTVLEDDRHIVHAWR